MNISFFYFISNGKKISPTGDNTSFSVVCRHSPFFRLRHLAVDCNPSDYRDMKLKNLVYLIVFTNIEESHLNAFSSVPRKRLGKNSFIQKQEQGKYKVQSNVLIPDALQQLALKYRNRTPGSAQYKKAWNNWASKAIESIRHDLFMNLPYLPDRVAFEGLFFNLGVAADEGIMPSFSDPGARAGYALEFFSRARGLADLFLDTQDDINSFPMFWKEHLDESPLLGGPVSSNGENNSIYNITSIGGGPGFDFVGAAMAASFSSIVGVNQKSKNVSKINSVVLDYEEGWSSIVESMHVSTSNVLMGESFLSCIWGGKCDITKEMSHMNNDSCRELVSTTDLWVCQFCVAENAKLLRDSKFIFFSDLFENMKEGSLFIFTEITPRVWPDFYNIIENCDYNMQISFLKKGRIMLLYKRKKCNSKEDINQAFRNSETISDEDLELIQSFESIGKSHDSNRSRMRQLKKIK